MTRDHRYPSEVKKDASDRLTLARHPEMRRMIQTTSAKKIALAGMLLDIEDRLNRFDRNPETIAR